MMKRTGLVLLLLAVLIQGGNSQTYDATIQMSVSGGVLNVDLYLATTGGTSAVLGDATLTISFNGAALVCTGKDGSKDGRWDDGNDASYQDVWPTGLATKASLTVLKSGTGVGLNIPTTSTRVGRLQFEIMDPSATPTILWNTKLTDVKNFTGSTITPAITFVNPDDVPLPITLSSFTASVNGSEGGVKLEWKTASEVDNYGYTVQRKGDREYADLAGSFIAGKGTTVVPQSYSYVDKSIGGAGTYTYRLKQQDVDGTVHCTQSVVVTLALADVPEEAPREFRLVQNYPNPFNPSTKVKFSVESSEHAVVKVYNMLGEEVAMLFNGVAEAGRYYVATFDASRLATGVYIYRLTTDSKTDVKKMLLVK